MPMEQPFETSSAASCSVLFIRVRSVLTVDIAFAMAEGFLPALPHELRSCSASERSFSCSFTLFLRISSRSASPALGITSFMAPIPIFMPASHCLSSFTVSFSSLSFMTIIPFILIFNRSIGKADR